MLTSYSVASLMLITPPDSFPLSTVTPSFERSFNLKQATQFNILEVGSLFFSGKSMLFGNLLKLKHPQEEHARVNFPRGLSMYKAVMMKDKINEESKWINSTKYNVEILEIGEALALRSHQIPSFTVFSDFSITEPGVQVSHDSFKMLKCAEELVTTLLACMNIWDVGVNKAVFSILLSQFRDLHLHNALCLKDAQEYGLYQPPDLRFGSHYGGNYSNRSDNERQIRLHSALKYYVRIIDPSMHSPQSTLLVGTIADQLDEAKLKWTELDGTRLPIFFDTRLYGHIESAYFLTSLLIRQHKWESWLEVKSECVLWQTMLRTLRGTDLVELVRKVCQISCGSDLEEVLSDRDEVDAGFVEVCIVIVHM